MIILTTIIFFC